MAAPTAATNYLTMGQTIFNNIHSLSESATDLKARLTTWRDQFFPLLDQTNVEEAKMHSWIVPTSQLAGELSSSAGWYEVDVIVEIMFDTLAAVINNGYVVPRPGFEAAMVAVFNTAWT
jgi:hypothetical protein